MYKHISISLAIVIFVSIIVYSVVLFMMVLGVCNDLKRVKKNPFKLLANCEICNGHEGGRNIDKS